VAPKVLNKRAIGTMSKILALGAVLPEFAADRRLVAASYRMEQFITPLLQDGHSITVCGTNYYDPIKEVKVSKRGGLIHYQMDFGRDRFLKETQSIHDEFKPDCIIGVQRVGALAAAGLKSHVPIWIDLFGSPMCEAQAKSYVYNDDRWIHEFWHEDQTYLLRGDIFSTCGSSQEHFLTGQLSLLGRLSKSTLGYKFVYAVPPGIPTYNTVSPKQQRLLQGRYIREDDFALLWCGGYNVWTDVDTLFNGLELAFAANEKIKFVSLGGCIKNHDDLTYPRFQEMIRHSQYNNRFILLGWRSYADALQAYSECDLGINIDKYHYEPVYGTRTRIVEMIQNRLPVITSLACELSYLLMHNDLALTFDTGNAPELASKIIEFSKKSRAERVAFAEKSYLFFCENFNYKKTTEPLRAWARNPIFAPDRGMEDRPILVLKSNLEHFRKFFEEHPENNISLKRLIRSKLKGKLKKFI